MKNLFLILLLPLVLGLTSCVKQKNCNCGIEGTFVYEPVMVNGEQYHVGKFYINDDYYYAIEGHIPKKIRSETPIKVNACLERIGGYAISPTIMKFTCVEKIK